MKNTKLLAALTVGTFAVGASAAQTWTTTTTGTIQTGQDYSGVFGPVNQNLAGLSFKQSITASVDPALWSQSGNFGWYKNVAGIGPAFTDTVTVNGKTITFDAISTTGSANQQLIGDGISTGKGGLDQIYSVQEGRTTAGGFLTANQFTFSGSTAFVPTLDFGQTLSQDITGPSFSKEAAFNFMSGNQNVYFNGLADTIAVNVPAVPEPETHSMLLAGLGLLGFLARRKGAAKP